MILRAERITLTFPLRQLQCPSSHYISNAHPLTLHAEIKRITNFKSFIDL
jgi:hypothetical protein